MPYAQRSWIALVEKDCDFELVEVSLKDKETFTQAYHKVFGADRNSMGRVPILVNGDEIFCES